MQINGNRSIYLTIYRSVISISITNRSLDKSQTIGKLERAQFEIMRLDHGPNQSWSCGCGATCYWRRLIEFVIKPDKAAA